MGNIITPVLPHDLPENWNDTQYVSPGGTEVGLTEKHGYNYLMKQVNNSQKAINELDAELENIDTTLQNKAPAGYGLGTTPKKITDWNDAKIDGWYYSSEGAANAPDSTVGCFGLVYNQGGPEVCVQEVWGLLNVDKYHHWRRLVYPESGTPWEWVDPPLYEGVVYRTTERHLGNPVYKKMDSNGIIWWSTDQSTWKCESERVGAYSKTEADTLLQNKAQSEYGPRYNDIPYNADGITKNGFFICKNGVPTNDWGCVVHAQYTENRATQWFKPAYDWSGVVNITKDTLFKREKFEGVWYPWEYVNPPMALGVEYRTTERYMGKPVYVKLIDVGQMPNTDQLLVSANIGNNEETTVIGFDGYMDNGVSIDKFPVFWSPGELKAYMFVMVYGIEWRVGVRSLTDLSAYTAKCLIKYTKIEG